MPIGKDKDTQITPKIMLSIKPPMFREATGSSASAPDRLGVMKPQINHVMTPAMRPAKRPPAKLVLTILL